jgi:superfamily II DNA helicase RecQ
MQEIPRLLDKVKLGDYRIVFVQPEFCQASNADWRKITAPNSRFLKKTAIVIDEAHLIHQWRSFRERYTHLASLRHVFGAPFLMCSATMMPYVRRFVHRTMHLNPRVSFVHRSVDRTNVFISVQRITTTTSHHGQLYFLVLKGIQHPAQIPQTVVFVDSRPDAKKACDEFWTLVPSEWKERPEYKYVFAECSTILTSKRRWVIMTAFSKGLCRILFATEVAGMGIDFPGIQRVVQWRVGATLNISAVLQRLGRASRRPGSQGVFILFHTGRYRITERTESTVGVTVEVGAGVPRYSGGG